jgi:hypothetical protein
MAPRYHDRVLAPLAAYTAHVGEYIVITDWDALVHAYDQLLEDTADEARNDALRECGTD